ncbi:MAG TPA: type VI secretion system tip protein TssI/VgrG [Acetobacteraceae bacterium]|nr:type VI secretion system tip protein TssI/VgrG [Acetobacteraceae bacterium]
MSGGSSRGPSQGYVTITIDPHPGIDLQLHSLHATEELGRPFEYNLVLSSDKPTPDLTSWLGASATLGITLPDKSKRYFNAIIARAVYDGLQGGGYRYHLELRPWIWLLSRQQNCVIFQNESVWDIINKIFSTAGFTKLSDKRQNQAGSEVLEYCVQYNESSLDFVTRLMEKYGIYYYFTHTETDHTLVFADDPNSHTALKKAIPFVYRQTQYTTVDDHIWEWTADQRLQPGAATFNDYNFTTPSADLTAKSTHPASHPHSSFEVYEFPGPYQVVADGTKISDIRMQRFTAQSLVLRGVSNSRLINTGCKLTMSGFADASQNIEYLVIGATYTLGQAEGLPTTDGNIADSYVCLFHAIPGTTPFQLEEKTRWPLMHGPQTAKVTGDSGDEITTDKYGRIKVKFPWDRSNAPGGSTSCWIRVAQIWAGTQWGALYTPRVGQEVVVDFLNGNPDRPIIVGSVYNATNMPPDTLPDNKTKSDIKTNSSLGGGGYNQLRFEDKKGSEEVYFQAEKDYNKLVKNNETVTIDKGNRSITLNTGNNSLTVSKGDNSVTVSEGNNSLTVSQKNNSVTVSQGNDSLTVSQGNHSITVTTGTSTVDAGQSITLKVGSNSIVISTSGITLTGGTISVSATESMSANGGGSMTLQAGEISIN